MIVRRPRVAVAYNEPILPAEHPDWHSESSVVAVARSIMGALNAEGFEATLVAVAPPLSGFLERLSALAPDLVFNLVEGYGGETAAEPYVAALFELIGVPYTGSAVEALAGCRSKGRTKALLRGYGLPTAPFVVVGPGEAIPRFDWLGPVMVKPEAEDASLGIDQESIVSDPGRLADRVERLHLAYRGPVLIESYLPGPEFNVGVLALSEPGALPVARVVFADRPGAWPILTYAAKWDEGSLEDRSSPIECPARIDPALAHRLGRLAEAAFVATGCRDYARVDFRLDARGEPMILEVNPNPDLGPGSGLARAAVVAGMEYNDAVAAIARQALARAATRLQDTTSNQTSERSSIFPL